MASSFVPFKCASCETNILRHEDIHKTCHKKVLPEPYMCATIGCTQKGRFWVQLNYQNVRKCEEHLPCLYMDTAYLNKKGNK